MDNFSKILKILFFLFVVIPHHLPVQPAGSGPAIRIPAGDPGLKIGIARLPPSAYKAGYTPLFRFPKYKPNCMNRSKF